MQITILVDADAVALAMSEAGNRYQNATAYVQAVVDQFLAPLVTRTVCRPVPVTGNGCW